MRFRFLALALAAVLMTAGFARAASVIISTSGAFTANTLPAGWMAVPGSGSSITVTGPSSNFTLSFVGIAPTLFTNFSGDTISSGDGLFFGTFLLTGTGDSGVIDSANGFNINFALTVTQTAPVVGGTNTTTGTVDGSISSSTSGGVVVLSYSPNPFFIGNVRYVVDTANLGINIPVRQFGTITTPAGTPNIVPVPPAVFAGLGLLGVVGAIRSRRQA
jgi:hypothetical protein